MQPQPRQMLWDLLFWTPVQEKSWKRTSCGGTMYCNMLQEWITVQTGTVRPEARGIKLSDELMGDAMRFVACHEVGHSFGLRHNMMGSWAFPTDSLRSKSFTDRMNSTSSSIMDYARFNYVAQPGDGITALSPHIGPYDLFAIEYGYRWYGKETPEEEKDLLYDFLSRHTRPSL